jgi:hypothetical protein
MYELFDEQHEDIMPVTFLLQLQPGGDKQDLSMPESCQLEEIKSQFSEAVEKHRVEKKLPLNQALAERQVISSLAQDPRCRVRDVVNADDLYAALRAQLNMELSREDVDSLLRAAKKEHGDRLTLNGLVSFLRVTDKDLDSCTMSDARSATITLLRRRLKAISDYRDSTEVKGRVQELQYVTKEREAVAAEPRAILSPMQLHTRPATVFADGQVSCDRREGKRLIPLPPHDCKLVV